MRSCLIVLIFIISSVFVFAQSLNDSLLLHYPMNGNCNDVSGNNFHAALINATLTSDHNGNTNSAYHFDGATEYINWPSSLVLHPGLPITIAFWVKYDSNDYLNSFLFDTDFAQDNYSGIHCNLTPSLQITFSFGDCSGSTSPAARRSKTGSSSLQINTWYFVVAVMRGATDMDIYINCVNDGGTYSGSGGSIAYTGTPGILGRSDGDMYAPARYFLGSLDDFRYWNRALSAAEILSLCSSNNPIIESNGCYDGVYYFSLQNAGSYSGVTWDFGDPASGSANKSVINNPTHVFSGPGTYQVTAVVSYYIGSPVSTIYSVVVQDEPDLIPYDSVFECEGSSKLIEVEGIWDSYLWSNSAVTTSILVSASGIYSVTANDSDGCVVADTVVAVFDNTTVFETDTTFCNGCSIVFDGQVISAAGDYSFTYPSGSGCDTIINLHATVENAPFVLLPDDTTLCTGMQLNISPLISGSWNTGIWSDSVTTSARIINVGGVYFYSATGMCGTAEDEIIVAFEDCVSGIFFPNVFTPNGDIYNPVFRPDGFNIEDFHIIVFNRWGGQVYEGFSISDGWDGTFKGQECPEGVYFWIAEYKVYQNNVMVADSAKGSVTLLR